MTWQSQLLSWYRKHRRDLPWRRTQDPYKIWVSEIMLQQTTVEAVIPYYEKFLKAFPTVGDLARASEEEVLRLWSGLGYYSRARNLLKAAQMVVRGKGDPEDRFKKKGNARSAPALPNSVEGLMALPGIGRYTAGAVASIAFGKKAPILDGNVIRVLSRLFCISKDPKSTAGQKVFWEKAEDILPDRDCGDFNQALMELGATVCVPENPLCLLCPVAESCGARKKGQIGSFPLPKKKTDYQDVVLSAAVVREGDKVLLVQRPGKGLLRGMWEFPMVEGGVRELSKVWPVAVLSPLPSVRHSILNRRLKVWPFRCRLLGSPSKVSVRWVSLEDFFLFPSSSLNRKIFSLL